MTVERAQRADKVQDSPWKMDSGIIFDMEQDSKFFQVVQGFVHQPFLHARKLSRLSRTFRSGDRSFGPIGSESDVCRCLQYADL